MFSLSAPALRLSALRFHRESLYKRLDMTVKKQKCCRGMATPLGNQMQFPVDLALRRNLLLGRAL